MEKRVLGILLTVLGIIGLIWAGVVFIGSGYGATTMKMIISAGVIGAVFFFAGVGLIRSTKDRPT